MVNKLSDTQFDRLFEAAVVRNFEDMLNALPPEEELKNSHTFSEQHNSRMQRLIRRVRREDVMGNVFFYVRKTAAAAAAIIAFLFISLYTFSPDVRAAVNDVIIRWHEGFTQFISREPASAVDEPINWSPHYLPQGFEKIDEIDLGDTVMIIFSNLYGDEISLTIIQYGGSISVDNEDAEYQQVLGADGNMYYQFVSLVEHQPHTILWSRDGYSFAIAAEIPIDELQAIAESVSR